MIASARSLPAQISLMFQYVITLLVLVGFLGANEDAEGARKPCRGARATA
jgi:ABC-type uncharacterized transport system permease subunit